MDSSWIESLAYKSLPDGSYIALFLKVDKCPTCHRETYAWDKQGGRRCIVCEKVHYPSVALLYGGPTSPIPSWLPGLISAGTGKGSPGRAYNKLLKGKYPSQRIEGQEKIQELRRMLA